jgi:hypothetical protein
MGVEMMLTLRSKISTDVRLVLDDRQQRPKSQINICGPVQPFKLLETLLLDILFC